MIAGGAVLLLLGAIASFAVSDNIEGVDLVTAGYIAMAVGVVLLVAGIVLRGRSHRSEITSVEGVDAAGRRVNRTSTRDTL